MTEPLSKSASWFAQMALIVTWLVALVVAVRLLVVATWSRRTALAILQTGGTANVITGVIVSTLGIACGAALCLYLITRLYLVVANKHGPTRTDLIVALTVVLWEALVVPLYIVAITIVVVALVVAAGKYRRSRSPAGGEFVNPRTAGLVGVVAGVLVVLLVDGRPWLPPENITLGEKPEVITAYVLQYDEHNLAVLRGHRPRQVFHMINPAVTKREICGGTSLWWNASALKNVLGLTPYPRCHEQH